MKDSLRVSRWVRCGCLEDDAADRGEVSDVFVIRTTPVLAKTVVVVHWWAVVAQASGHFWGGLHFFVVPVFYHPSSAQDAKDDAVHDFTFTVHPESGTVVPVEVLDFVRLGLGQNPLDAPGNRHTFALFSSDPPARETHGFSETGWLLFGHVSPHLLVVLLMITLS